MECQLEECHLTRGSKSLTLTLVTVPLGARHPSAFQGPHGGIQRQHITLQIHIMTACVPEELFLEAHYFFS